MHPEADDMANNEVLLCDLHPDLVTPWSRDTKVLCRLFHPFTVQADARKWRVVRDGIFRYVLVKNAPIACLIVVDRLDVTLDQALVFFS